MTSASGCAGVGCQNSPVVATLNITAPHPGAQPATQPLPDGNHVGWSRLLPIDMKADEMEAVLHRSHHAMAYGGKIAVNGAPGHFAHWYLLWAGYDRDMRLLSDAWVVYVYPAGACAALSRNEWWPRAWCWTAQPAEQRGVAPPGRAYAQMTMLTVRSLLCF